MKFQKTPLIIAPTGSKRYGYGGDSSDQDIMILSEMEDQHFSDLNTGTDYFFVSLETFRYYWAHPLRLADLVSDCTGNDRICDFLRGHKKDIPYAAPTRTALFGLEYIAQGERSKYNSTIKTSLRTAMILSHMAAQAEDPFFLSEAEKSILVRARTGSVPAEERVDIYRRTISPESIDRLMKMPDHPTIKNELFQLIEEVIAC